MLTKTALAKSPEKLCAVTVVFRVLSGSLTELGKEVLVLCDGPFGCLFNSVPLSMFLTLLMAFFMLGTETFCVRAAIAQVIVCVSHCCRERRVVSVFCYSYALFSEASCLWRVVLLTSFGFVMLSFRVWFWAVHR